MYRGSRLVIRRGGGLVRIGPRRDFMQILDFPGVSAAKEFLREQNSADAGLKWLREFLKSNTDFLVDPAQTRTDEDVLEYVAQLFVDGSWQVAEIRQLESSPGQEVAPPSAPKPQPKPQPKTHWFELQILDAAHDDEPINDVSLLVDSQHKTTSRLAEDGMVRMDRLTDEIPREIEVDDSALSGKTVTNFVVPVSGAVKERGYPLPKNGRWVLVGAKEHRLSEGETLADIAGGGGVSEDELVQFNFGVGKDHPDLEHLLYKQIGCIMDVDGKLSHDDARKEPVLWFREPLDLKDKAVDSRHQIRVRELGRKVPQMIELLMRCKHAAVRPELMTLLRKTELKKADGSEDDVMLGASYAIAPSAEKPTDMPTDDIELHAYHSDYPPPNPLLVTRPDKSMAEFKRTSKSGRHSVYKLEKLQRFGIAGDGSVVKTPTEKADGTYHEKEVTAYGKANRSLITQGFLEMLTDPAANLITHLFDWYKSEPQLYEAEVFPGVPLNIETHYPHKWELQFTLPPAKSFKAGHKSTKSAFKDEERAKKQEQDFKTIEAADRGKVTVSSRREGGNEILVRTNSDSGEVRQLMVGSDGHTHEITRTGKIETGITHDKTAGAGDMAKDVGKGMVGAAGSSDPISLKLNGQAVVANPLRMIGSILVLYQQIMDLVKAIKDAVPKIGWYIDFELQMFQGSLKGQWGRKEHTDHRVYPWWAISIGMTFFQITLELGVGIEFGPLKAQIYFNVTGAVSSELTVERDGPDADKGVVVGPTKQELTAKLGARVEAGVLLKCDAFGETGAAVELTIFIGHRGRTLAAKLNFIFKGVVVKLVCTTFFGSDEYSKPLIEKREMGIEWPSEHVPPDPPKLLNEAIYRIIESAFTSGWNQRVFGWDDGSWSKQWTLSDIIKPIVTKIDQAPNIKRDRATIKALANAIDQELNILWDNNPHRGRFDWPWVSEPYYKSFLNGKLDELIEDCTDPTAVYAAELGKKP